MTRTRALVLTALLIAWTAVLLWLLGTASMACVYPDPPPGGCPAGEARAAARFDLWFFPALAAGPLLMPAAWTALKPRSRR